MSTTTMTLSRRLNSYWQFMHCQWLNLIRMPAYTIPTLLFPVMFYAFFGLLMIPGLAGYLLATYSTFGVLGAALFSFGVGIATERAQGWFVLIRATPAPLMGVVLGKWFGAALFGAIITVSLCVLAAAFGEVRLPQSQWWGLLGVMVLGTLPFCLLGLGLGLLLSPGSAPAVINLIYLPMGFLAGLWIPISQFPAWLQAIAPWLPPYHLAALALHVTGVQTTEPLPHVLALLAFSAGFALLVAWGWRRMQTQPR
ncbi:ABC transporter permease [Wenzhouxiangella marina]|uniref:Transport permease protein n=1 Tax=Wenzhouxiangella marina TaxID=1579979 RepID=A0A0K0XUM6_9GAMM|nr:ABC transporter permease [Wenzhouxiangella marina]AKS41321.1 Transport permease protein [Wenzhouxiangella marina]MBB6086929.1 ABC-2 type transport system permease protein [Wenzhouxiangella marina]